MATSIFDEKAVVPNDDMVGMVLAGKKDLWDKLKSHVLENYKDISQNWKFYNKKSGWSLLVKKKARTLFYFVPCSEYFKILFVFGEKAVKAAAQSSIPEYIKAAIHDAATHVEGKSFIVEVKDDKDLEPVKILLKIKDES